MVVKTRSFPRAWLVITWLIPLVGSSGALTAPARIKRAEAGSLPVLTALVPATPLLITTPQLPPQATPTPTRAPAPASSPTPGDGDPLNLIIPVEGIDPDDLRDTFNASRSGGRTHRAIDIMAPCGTPALAATDGEVVRVVYNARGGNTIYQMSDDRKLVFYYAHLDRYADDLAKGQYARQGEVIGYVGDTGNAGAGNCHLHFSIWAITDPKKYWAGDNINPYPILRGTR